jgi:hypothetical protein
MTVVKELSKYELNVVGVWEVRWGRDGSEPAGEYTIFFGKGNDSLLSCRIRSLTFAIYSGVMPVEGCPK